MNSLKTIFLGLLFLCSFLSADGQFDRTIKVATWNIEHLRVNNNSGAVRRNNADFERLKKYADRLDADVIALQEVEGEGAAQRVFDPEVYNFFFSRRSNVMLTGFAVKKHLQVTQNPDFTDLDVDGLGDLRYGTDITISSNGDSLRLLSIHLKSRCFQNDLFGSSSCQKLRRQLNQLEEWIDNRSDGSIPYIVLGDYNRRLNIRDDQFWLEIDDSVPTNSDLFNTTQGKTSECWNSEYPEYIDHIVLDLRAQRMFKENSFQQLIYDQTDERFKDQISDHCPILVELELRDTLTYPVSILKEVNEMKTMVDSLQRMIQDLQKKLRSRP